MTDAEKVQTYIRVIEAAGINVPHDVAAAADRLITSAEILRYAELLITQLPKTHDGRNTWLMNYGRVRE